MEHPPPPGLLLALLRGRRHGRHTFCVQPAYDAAALPAEGEGGRHALCHGAGEVSGSVMCGRGSVRDRRRLERI